MRFDDILSFNIVASLLGFLKCLDFVTPSIKSLDKIRITDHPATNTNNEILIFDVIFLKLLFLKNNN